MTRPGRLCYVAPPEPGGCTSGRLLGPPVGRCTRTPLQAPTAPTVDSRRIHPRPHADLLPSSPGPPVAGYRASPPTGPLTAPQRVGSGRQVTRVPVRLSAYPGFPIGVSFSTPAGYFTHLHRTEHDPTRVAPCCNPAWEHTPGLSPLVSVCLCVARFGTPGAESGSEVIKHVRRRRDGERENRPGAFRPEAWWTSELVGCPGSRSVCGPRSLQGPKGRTTTTSDATHGQEFAAPVQKPQKAFRRRFAKKSRRTSFRGRT